MSRMNNCWANSGIKSSNSHIKHSATWKTRGNRKHVAYRNTVFWPRFAWVNLNWPPMWRCGRLKLTQSWPCMLRPLLQCGIKSSNSHIKHASNLKTRGNCVVLLTVILYSTLRRKFVRVNLNWTTYVAGWSWHRADTVCLACHGSGPN